MAEVLKPYMLDETGQALAENVGGLLTEATGKKIAHHLGLIAVAQIGNIHEITDWEEIHQLVKGDLGEEEFPTATILNVTNSDYGMIKLRVVDHNHHKNPHNADAPTLTVEMLNAINNMPFDAAEAIFAVAGEALAAGTYNITLPTGYDEAYGVGQTIQFTTTHPVPVGGQIFLSWPYNKQITVDGKISTYSGPTDTTGIETGLAVSVGTAGTSLGTADGTTPHMNHIQRARYGNSNARESALIQWINSAEDANSWWTPKNEWDRPPAYTNKPGLLHGMDPKFLAAIGEIDRKIKTNKVWENPLTCPEGINSFYTMRMKSFLLSKEEVGFAVENNIEEGTVLDFYNGITNEERIKYDHTSAGVARYVFLQSPYPGYAYYVRYVTTRGAENGNHAYYGYAASAAWIIY